MRAVAAALREWQAAGLRSVVATVEPGAVTPPETAPSLLAEVVAARHGRDGGRLGDSASERNHEVGAT